MHGHVLGPKPAAVAALGSIEHSLSNGVASRDETSMVEIKDRLAHAAERPASRPHAKIGTCFLILAGARRMLVSFNKRPKQSMPALADAIDARSGTTAFIAGQPEFCVLSADDGTAACLWRIGYLRCSRPARMT